jgi:hypothetical protein
MMRRLAAMGLIVFLPLTVWAQTDNGSAPESAASEFEKASRLPDSEKLERASSYTGEMKEVLTHVLRMLTDARDEKDVIKVNCVNEKLTSIKGLIRIAEQADITLQEAVAKGERDAATHEFHKISISHQKVKMLKTEAEQCVGELAFAVGKTTVEVEVDKDQVPEDDPTQVALPETPVVRPPAASPYQ